MDAATHPLLRMTFGMYRNACAACVAEQDAQYAGWCMSQEWFADQHPLIHQYWAALGITPPRKCIRTTKDGNPCTSKAKYGPLCGTHYRAAEKAMVAIVNEMSAEWEVIS